MPKTTKHFYCQNCFETNRARHMKSAHSISELWIARHLIQVRNVRYTWLGVFHLAVINVDNMTSIISTTEEMELGHSPENTTEKWMTMKNSSQKGKQNPHIAYPIFKIKNQYKGGGLKNKLNEQKVNELLHKNKEGKK